MATRKKPVLGRNLSSMLSQSTLQQVEGGSRDELRDLPLDTIKPGRYQPRSVFDEDKLSELADSIRAQGVVQPIVVRPVGKGEYELIAGERRWRAAQLAGIDVIPAVIRDVPDEATVAMALIENIQREDLNPVEEARAYHRLSEDEGLTQAEIAQMVEKSRSHVANLQRLLALPEGVLALVEGGELSMGHARALIGNDDAVKLAKQAVREKLSVREVEDLARGDAAPKARKSPKRSTRDPAKDADIAAVQAHLEEFLGLTVRIKTEADPRKGAVTIKYRTLDQLDLICQRLTGGDI